jgi:diguanylate cyclase (GGDEF)-like protein
MSSHTKLQEKVSEELPSASAMWQADQPFRIMVADDDATSRRLLKHLLEKWGFEVVLVEDGLKAWETMKLKTPPSIVILDWVMPGLDGLELSRKIRALNCQYYTYILMLTSKLERTCLIEGLRAGVDDYLTKPFDAAELQGRLLVAERTLRFQNQLIAAKERIAQEARHDFLTGLLNRGGIMEVVEREMSRSNRTEEQFSILLADIDHFKRINDTFGHCTGDEVLREVANRIGHSLRSHDSVGRYGGEEFLIILPSSDESAALGAAEKLRRRICETPFRLGGTESRITISLGVATRVQEVSAESLICAADVALYRAKNGGRNCVQTAAIPT